MARICKLCALPNRAEIDQRLVAGEGSLREIAALCAVSEASVRRHQRNHIPATLAAAQEAADLANSDRLLDRVKSLNAEAQQILTQAKDLKNPKLALYAIDRLVKLTELQAKLVGELEAGTTINVNNGSNEAARIVAVIVSNVADSETRVRIAEALRAIS